MSNVADDEVDAAREGLQRLSGAKGVLGPKLHTLRLGIGREHGWHDATAVLDVAYDFSLGM